MTNDLCLSCGIQHSSAQPSLLFSLLHGGPHTPGFLSFFSFVIYVKKQQLRHSIRPAAFWMATYGTHEEKRSEKTYDKLWPEIQIRAKMRERKTEFQVEILPSVIRLKENSNKDSRNISLDITQPGAQVRIQGKKAMWKIVPQRKRHLAVKIESVQCTNRKIDGGYDVKSNLHSFYSMS